MTNREKLAVFMGWTEIQPSPNGSVGTMPNSEEWDHLPDPENNNADCFELLVKLIGTVADKEMAIAFNQGTHTCCIAYFPNEDEDEIEGQAEGHTDNALRQSICELALKIAESEI